MFQKPPPVARSISEKDREKKTESMTSLEKPSSAMMTPQNKDDFHSLQNY
jgi:hypothetical protein